MKPIIEITNLGKQYPILHEKRVYGTLRDAIMNRLRHPFSKSKTQETFWALKDINLSINRGDVVGIIGRNGAGKSTLLKILSGITKPTTGSVKLYGRVSSLLEVGTGFHPELTGRENIFLNGVILGMTRKEVARKFDEIVAFAGIEKFLDTPVKHYSSGMYVRLAFAIAAHLEPDILIVDEVLAVGDMEFQKKCLGKMEEVSKQQGRTVLFVSHNMGAISQLCSKIILIESGKIIMNSSNKDEVIEEYSRSLVAENDFKISENSKYALIEMTTYNYLTKQKTLQFSRKDDILLKIKINIKENVKALIFGYTLFYEGHNLYYSLCTDTKTNFYATKGVVELNAIIPTSYLNTGKYKIGFIAGIHPYEWIDSPKDCKSLISFDILDFYQSNSIYWQTKRSCLITPIIKWS